MKIVVANDYYKGYNSNMAIQIEKDVPIPRTPFQGGHGKGKCQQALKAMAVGDSITVPFIGEHTRSNWYTLANAYGVKITTRVENGEQLRVWRIE